MEGEDVTLKCSADGVPTPSLRWDFVQTESSSSNSSSGVTVQPSESRGNASEKVNALTVSETKIKMFLTFYFKYSVEFKKKDDDHLPPPTVNIIQFYRYIATT